MLSLPVLAAAGGMTETAAEIARTFGIDARILVANLICFIIVAVVLRKFAFRPVLIMLEERRKRIATLQADSERLKTELAKLDAERQQRLRETQAQAERLIDEARRAAEQLRQAELAQVKEESARILAETRDTAARDVARLRDELQREIGHLAVQMAGLVARQTLTPEDQERLARETMRNLPA